jgi:lipopolysaccharide export system protein LptA
MTRLKYLTIITLTTYLFCSYAAALPEDRDKKIIGKAHTTQIDANTGKTVFKEDVVIRQGFLSIFADEVTIDQNSTTEEIEYMLATGDPVKFIDTPSSNGKQIEVKGRTIEFFPLKNLIITLGQAEIQMDGNSAKGERIQYNTVTGVITIESEKTVNSTSNGEQAEFILQPGTNN